LPPPLKESAPERIYPEDCGFYFILAGPDGPARTARRAEPDTT